MREALILGGLGSAISPFCLKTLRFNPYTNKRIDTWSESAGYG